MSTEQEPHAAKQPPARARARADESVIRVSEVRAARSERKPRTTEPNPETLTAAGEATSTDPHPINLHGDMGWVYPSPPDKYHFHWEPPDLGQEPPTKWRRKWNEAVNMFKYFRLVNDPEPARPPRESSPSQVYRGLEELRDLKPTEPDAI